MCVRARVVLKVPPCSYHRLPVAASQARRCTRFTQMGESGLFSRILIVAIRVLAALAASSRWWCERPIEQAIAGAFCIRHSNGLQAVAPAVGMPLGPIRPVSDGPHDLLDTGWQPICDCPVAHRSPCPLLPLMPSSTRWRATKGPRWPGLPQRAYHNSHRVSCTAIRDSNATNPDPGSLIFTFTRS